MKVVSHPPQEENVYLSQHSPGLGAFSRLVLRFSSLSESHIIFAVGV